MVLPTVIFSEQMTLDLGNCTCVLQHVTSAHARDTVIVWVQEEQMVFLGDAVYQELVVDTWHERPAKLRQLIRELEPLEFQMAQPGAPESHVQNRTADVVSAAAAPGGTGVGHTPQFLCIKCTKTKPAVLPQ